MLLQISPQTPSIPVYYYQHFTQKERGEITFSKWEGGRTRNQSQVSLLFILRLLKPCSFAPIWRPLCISSPFLCLSWILVLFRCRSSHKFHMVLWRELKEATKLPIPLRKCLILLFSQSKAVTQTLCWAGQKYNLKSGLEIGGGIDLADREWGLNCSVSNYARGLRSFSS